MHNLIQTKWSRRYVFLVTTISLPLFSGILASLRAAIVLAPDDIPTCINQDDLSYKMSSFWVHLSFLRRFKCWGYYKDVTGEPNNFQLN